MNIILLINCLIIIFLLCEEIIAVRFQVIREWNYLNFTWPRDTIFNNNTYIPENNIIGGLKFYDNFYYLTLPRMKNGVPATLVRIPYGPITVVNTSPNLEPFPSWKWNELNYNCETLKNVQNIEIDSNGLMWIIDGGKVNTLTNPQILCPPKLIIFNIKLNKTNNIYEFPKNVADKNTSFLYDLVIDQHDGGYAYITDNGASDPGIIVYSLKENHSWKFRHTQSMTADHGATHFMVNGISIDFPINIAGIALGPHLQIINNTTKTLEISDNRLVYYCPLSSLHLYSITTEILKNPRLDQQNNGIIDLGMKESQTVGMITDNNGILYYSLLGNNAIGSWDTINTPFKIGQKIIAHDDKYIEWPNSFTFDQSGNLTLIINRLNKFIYDKININEPNFRLISAQVGSKSYLYDNQFLYKTHDMMNPDSHFDLEPKPEPEPEPEPTQELKSQNNFSNDNVEINKIGYSTNINSATNDYLAFNIIFGSIVIVFQFL